MCEVSWDVGIDTLCFFVKDGNLVELVVIWLALSGVIALIDEWLRPPFEWQEVTDDGLLRRKSDRTDD